MLIGYARVSTQDQELALQREALTGAGVDPRHLHVDRISGTSRERPGLDAALAELRAGDVLVVWRLDRLGRSLTHLIEVVARIEAAGVGLRSLTEAIDTTTPGGRLVFHIFGAMAEFERELIRERTLAGLEAARRMGRRGGRPTKRTPELVSSIQALRATHLPDTVIARQLGINRGTLHRHAGPRFGGRGAVVADRSDSDGGVTAGQGTAGLQGWESVQVIQAGAVRFRVRLKMPIR